MFIAGVSGVCIMFLVSVILSVPGVCGVSSIPRECSVNGVCLHIVIIIIVMHIHHNNTTFMSLYTVYNQIAMVLNTLWNCMHDFFTDM